MKTNRKTLNRYSRESGQKWTRDDRLAAIKNILDDRRGRSGLCFKRREGKRNEAENSTL